ncbi:MAG: metallophosphoesterase [Candidatus Poribacteria bacterium]|nr:metallophosphoesterase [Candidatus Poribacteria bacterium]
MREAKYNLTLVAMGALSPFPSETREMDEVISDINSLNPDVVMVLGDLGPVRQGFDSARKTLSALEADVLPALGDQDVQAENCETDAEHIKLFTSAFGLNRHYYTYENAGILFVTLSAERCHAPRWQADEVFLSDEQLTWFEETLEHHPTTPTIVQCHAPVFGTQIPIAPSVHARVTNPYINYNHHPKRLLEIIQNHPQIILWFSGHSHLGQGYPNSICCRNGVYFVHVGVHANQSTGDGERHSRVVEIQPEHLRIRTFDHAQRHIAPHHDYNLKEGPQGLMRGWEVATPAGFLSGHLRGFHVNQDGLSLKPLPTSGYLTYLDSPAVSSIHAIYPTPQKIYVATQGGYVWEYDRASGLPLDRIYLGKKPTCVVATESHVWLGGGDGYLRKAPIDRPERLLRKNAVDIPLKGTVRAMQRIQGRLFVGADRRLYEIHSETDELIPKAVFKTNVLSLHPHQNRLYVLTENGEISVFTLPDLQPVESFNVPSQGSGEEHPATADFIHITDRFCFFASQARHDIIKASLSDMRVVDWFRIHGKLKTALFDADSICILTEAGRLVCIDTKAMTVKAQRELEMKAASTMAMDDQFIYVATANPNCRWQEIQIIERRTDMIGELSYSVRTVDKIYPELEMDMKVTKQHLFHPQLRAKIYGKWVNLKNEILPSQEFEIRVILGRGHATKLPHISRMKLRDRL